jgi:hypothetical protein
MLEYNFILFYYFHKIFTCILRCLNQRTCHESIAHANCWIMYVGIQFYFSSLHSQNFYMHFAMFGLCCHESIAHTTCWIMYVCIQHIYSPLHLQFIFTYNMRSLELWTCDGDRIILWLQYLCISLIKVLAAKRADNDFFILFISPYLLLLP